MEATPLPTLDGLPSAVAAACDHSGRYTLNSVACSVDAVDIGVTESINDEKHSVDRSKISKMKGQGLNCITNASLMSVNLRYIAYAMKEGVVRIISQNGKDMFKMSNISKAPIADIATLGTDKGQGANFLVCLDNAGHALVYDMEAKKAWVMIFPEADAPLFVRAHPSEPDLFVTVCKRYLTVWSLPKLLAAEQSPPPAEMQRKPAEDYGFRMVTDDLLLSCGSRAVLPAFPSLAASLPRCLKACSKHCLTVFIQSLTHAEAQILDAAVSVSGEFLCALYGEHIVTWRLVASSIGVEPELQPIQLTSLPQASGICSIRILGNGGLAKQGGCPMPGSHEVLVVGSNNGRDLAVYELSPESPANPIGALLQSIHVDSSSESVSLSVNTITQDSLVLAFQADQFVLVLPLAAGWANGPNCPFPFVQQVRCDESAHQLSVMTGKSFSTSGHTLFVYRAHNFTREKDGLMGCNVVVDEVKGELIARSEPIASSDASLVAAGASAIGAAASSDAENVLKRGFEEAKTILEEGAALMQSAKEAIGREVKRRRTDTD